jgi:hypothetical protein
MPKNYDAEINILNARELTTIILYSVDESDCIA